MIKRICFLFIALLFASGASLAAEGGKVSKRDWSFEGMLGHYDKSALQRGFQVYREVCSACHGLKYIAFRNLSALGYNEAEIKAIAAEYEIMDGPNDEGEMFLRAGVPADRFPDPFANENEARAANGGSYPPDLSLMVKARADGANYIYSLLVGYADAPSDMVMPEGMHFNEAYGGNMIAMAQPLYGEDVEYADGSDNSVAGVSADVVHFLAWTAEPEMESRKRIGIAVLIFLVVMCFVSYGAKRHVWYNLKK